MLKKLSLLIACIVLVLSACRKSDRQNDSDTQSSTDYLQAQNYFLNTATTVFELIRNRPEIYLDADTANHYDGSCPSIKFAPAYPDSTTFPKTIVIDYGSTNCSAGGFNRRGKLNITINSNPLYFGSQITISPNGFYINDHELRGGITLRRDASTTPGYAVYTETVSSGEVHVNSFVSYFNHSIKRERIAGDTTKTLTDDEYRITGSGSGYATRGANYSFSIKTPYSIKPSCGNMSDGTSTLIPGSLSERTISLGAGCDKTATVVIFGQSFEVTYE